MSHSDTVDSSSLVEHMAFRCRSVDPGAMTPTTEQSQLSLPEFHAELYRSSLNAVFARAKCECRV